MLNLLSLLIQQKAPWVIVRIFLAAFCNFEVRGLDNLRKVNGNAIFACNHTSELDIILLPAALPFWSKHSPMFYTSREKSFYGGLGWRRHFYGGILFKLLGSYPVVVGLHDYNKSLSNQIRILRDRRNLCIFPEGRTTPNGEVQSFKSGVAYISYITSVPIIPVKILGIFRFSVKRLLMRKIHLAVCFGDPIFLPAKNEYSLTMEECKDTTNSLRNIIINMV